LPEPPVPDGTYSVDTTESVIRWTGRNLFNHHSGTVRLAGGEPSRREASEIDRLQAGPSGRGLREQPNQIRVNRGQLASARFTIDMTSIACEDLADPALNAMLSRTCAPPISSTPRTIPPPSSSPIPPSG